MRLNLYLRAWLAKLLPSDAVPILCPSIGRVGSKVLIQSLFRGRAQVLFGFDGLAGRRLIVEGAWDLKEREFRHGTIYKTHDFPYDLVASPSLKVVYLYGCPSDSVLSVVRCRDTKGAEWIARHFANMHADGAFDELLHRDVLRLGEQIDAWYAVRDTDVLGLRYETLWDHTDLLSDFVGFAVTLPQRKVRKFTDMDPETIALARASYEELDTRVARMPNYFFSGPSDPRGTLVDALEPVAAWHPVHVAVRCRS